MKSSSSGYKFIFKFDFALSWVRECNDLSICCENTSDFLTKTKTYRISDQAFHSDKVNFSLYLSEKKGKIFF